MLYGTLIKTSWLIEMIETIETVYQINNKQLNSS